MSTHYTASGMPLVFTQEDFLVFFSFGLHDITGYLGDRPICTEILYSQIHCNICGIIGNGVNLTRPQSKTDCMSPVIIS